MKYIVKCKNCGSVNLKQMEYIVGDGENFKCLDCDNEMSLREIEFKEVKTKSKKVCTACGGYGSYKNGKCSQCNGTGYVKE